MRGEKEEKEHDQLCDDREPGMKMMMVEFLTEKMIPGAHNRPRLLSLLRFEA